MKKLLLLLFTIITVLITPRLCLMLAKTTCLTSKPIILAQACRLICKRFYKVFNLHKKLVSRGYIYAYTFL